MVNAESNVLLRATDLSKRYGSVQALCPTSFEVYEGEILVLLGPSGCGKSTTLRLLAGLERPDSGEIDIKERTLAHAGKGIFLPTEKRNMGMVFQSFAVWPHMTVADHVAFPLIVRGFPKKDISRKVMETLDFVNLGGLEDRLGTQLSGGQQQRLSLARALVYEPDILLLDEPLSNLDAKFRQQMRIELKRLQAVLGKTFIFVTHDQVEAMTLAHRVAVMNNGRLEQLGAPDELYEQPANAFVHSFLGTTIRIEAQWEQRSNGATLSLAGGFRLRPGSTNGHGAKVSGGSRKVLVTLRPEELEVLPFQRTPLENEIEAVVDNIIYLGDRYELTLNGFGTDFSIQIPDRSLLPNEKQILLGVDPHKIKVWPTEA